MLAFLKLTRPLNLLIIALTMAAMRYGVVGAFLDLHTALLKSKSIDPDGTVFAAIPHNVFRHGFGALDFWLLVLSTVLIAAGGNVINDYFDTRIDRVNKPGSVIVGRAVKRRVAMAGHLVLSAVGLLLGLFVAWHSGQLRWVLIPVFAIAALWTYSTTLKRTFLVGNLVIALLTALVPLTVGVYEVLALDFIYPKGMKATTTDGQVMEAVFDFNHPWYAILLFAFFAFLTTLVRELQKDMADVPGDRSSGRRTIPIVLGMKWAKAIALAQLAVALIGVLF
ncbi:MAG TPA: geranylgeranylglycerol-phosphate geranylgeranyltransferase, partial [Flavobacteriales bacterium]|nr:geranylgeranylglycerol-phosphate geranylgeranyltransferase [Flavobacteriales bacterium]